MVSLLNHGFSIYRCQPAITILQQNSDTIMAPAVTNQPAEQNPGTPNGVCGDWCMTSSLLCQQSLHLPKCIIVIPSPNIRNQCPRLRELAGRPRLLGLLFSTVTSSLCLPLSPSLFGSSPCGTTPLRRLPCPFGGTGFSSTDDLATLLGSPAPLSNLPNQSQHDQSSKCLRQLYVDFHGRKI